MMRKGKRKSATTYLAAGVLLTCFLAQTIDCYRLKKSERQREGRNDADTAKTIGLQEGKIVFGRVFEKDTGLESQGVDGTRKSSANASAEDETAYQADFAGWSKGQAHDTGSKEASWKRMAPSLQCGWDQMKFRAVGPGASQFAVEQGNGSPMPLSQVPATCGYGMQRNSLALVMLVPYDGCSVFQEGGSYVLPMRWQGIPVSLWCPKTAAPAPTTADPHPVPQTPSYLPSYPQMPQNSKNPGISNPKFPPSYFFPPYLPYPQYPSVVVPTTTTTTKKPEIPKLPQYPSFPFPPFYPYFPPPLPVTTAAPTTTAATTTTTTAKPAATAPPPVFPPPFYPPFFPPFPWPLPGPLPTTAPTTTTQTTTTQPTIQPQFPPYVFPPFFPPFPPFFPPVIPPYPQYTTSKPETTTTTSTTTEKTDSIVTPAPSHDHPHFHPHVHLPFPYPPPFPPPYPPPYPPPSP